jgi:hypothetical protein
VGPRRASGMDTTVGGEADLRASACAPSKVFECVQIPSPVTGARAASHEVRRVSECCVRRDRGPIGLPTPTLPSPVCSGAGGPFPAPSPVRCRTGSSSPTLRASSESFCPPSPRASRPRVPSRGVRGSLFATSTRVGLQPGSQPACHPSSAFRTPSTSLTDTCFAGLFHPAAASRVPPFRGFPSRTAAPAHRRPVPSRHCPGSPAAFRSRGFGSSSPVLALRAFLHARTRCRRPGVTPCERPVPSWASPPPGAPSRRRRGRLHALVRSWPWPFG